MADFILLMHSDARAPETGWDAYLAKLRQSGGFDGGSAIGDGATFCKFGPPAAVSTHLNGYIRVQADDLAAAQGFLAGNPCYEAGGTVEIRELPRD